MFAEAVYLAVNVHSLQLALSNNRAGVRMCFSVPASARACARRFVWDKLNVPSEER